jgi:Nif-specific regulatory protein
MQPHLFVLSGPLKGAVLELDQGTTLVGRDPSCRLYIDDTRVSRRHCELVRTAEQVLVRDANSRNGVLVNGVPVKEHILEPGDQIQVGNSILFFTVDAGDEAETGAGRVQEHPVSGETTVELSADEASWPSREQELAPGPPGGAHATITGRSADWLKFSTAIVSVRQTRVLKSTVIEEIAGLLHADRGALVPATERPDLGSITIWRGSPDTSFALDPAIVRQVARDRVAVVVSDVSGQRSEWVLCAPLSVANQTLGVIYLARARAPFERSDLEIATAAAGLAAMALDNARRAERLECENERLSNDITREKTLVGESSAMTEVHRLIARAAPNDTTVLILGESGTGKELAARAIHARSLRAKRLFTPINCASLSDTLLESHLFGHERGAFTGAVAQKQGLFEIADGGTVFLDEIGELPPHLQARLLRVLQEREFERVGGTRRIKVDVRVIAATNRNLKQALDTGKFREDLYFRLSVIAFTMPPLRERREDIALLARYFVEKHARRCGRHAPPIAPAALDALATYDWPGNVRELENAIERAIALGSTDEVSIEDLPDDVVEASTRHESMLLESLKATKADRVRQAMEQARGNYAEAARLLGIHVNALHRIIRNLGLRSQIRAIRVRFSPSDIDE